jgi:hypothetical protein
MGHWEHDGTYTGPNNGYDGGPPTLLAAGMVSRQLAPSGDTTINIDMWPLVVDTKFVGGSTTVEPEKIDGKPKPAMLTEGIWNVNWTIQRAPTNSDGFVNALIPAQNIFNSSAEDNLQIENEQFIGSMGTGNGLTITSNSVSHSLGSLEAGSSGWVNFNLEYVPFNLTGDLIATNGPHPNAWQEKSLYNMWSESIGPVWIIRNGVNDEPQDGGTDYANFGKQGNTTNGNGGVRFVIKPSAVDNPLVDSRTEEQGGLTVSELKFKTFPNEIQFTPKGYAGEADVWYLVKRSEAPLVAGDYANFTWLDTAPSNQSVAKTIAIPAGINGMTDDYTIYVFIAKDGKRSPVATLTSKAGVEIDVTLHDD